MKRIGDMTPKSPKPGSNELEPETHVPPFIDGDGKWPETTEDADKLLNEINLLKLEGNLFCFDQKDAGRRGRVVTFEDAQKKPATIEFHPDYGYPSVLAYKVLQAIFKKITDEGYPIPDTISLSQRELAALVGRTSFGGTTGKQIYRAVMQLHRSAIRCSWYDKESGEWLLASFYIVPSVLFSHRGGGVENIRSCTIQLDKRIVTSLNKAHHACFNWTRMQTLAPIGMAIYKRLFFHFSNLRRTTPPKELRFEKRYDAICQEWLGGLKPEQYRSRIVKQLGPHLAGLKRCKLIARYEVEPAATGDGFKIVFHPGEGFATDYEMFYVHSWQPQLRLRQSSDKRAIEEPLRLVEYFHDRLGRTGNSFSERETAYASSLLSHHSFDEVKDLIGYAIEEAAKTKFDMQQLGAIKQYVPRWEVVRDSRLAAVRVAEDREACENCDSAGYAFFRVDGRRPVAYQCPHDPHLIAARERQIAEDYDAPVH